MATVSIIMALMALGVAVPALIWCNRLSGNITRLIMNSSDVEGRKRLTELANECQLLHAHVDRLRQSWQADTTKLQRELAEAEHVLRQSWQADTTKLESAMGQLENRIIELEQAHNGLGTVSQDLESLRDFRSRVEQIHASIQKAFNGTFVAASSAMLRDEKSPGVDAQAIAPVCSEAQSL